MRKGSMMRKVVCGLLLFALMGCGSSGFVPDDFELPSGFETSEFRVRPIAVADAEKDYEAVMESVDIIHASLLSDRWPTESFTLDENRRDWPFEWVAYPGRTGANAEAG